VELMARLGYECYGIQPGDAGAFIAAEMGRFDAAHVIGVHVNSLVTCPSGDPTDKVSISHLKY
jgi:epoxide hydrolase